MVKGFSSADGRALRTLFIACLCHVFCSITFSIIEGGGGVYPIPTEIERTRHVPSRRSLALVPRVYVARRSCVSVFSVCVWRVGEEVRFPAEEG